jgi:hypothetical protein
MMRPLSERWSFCNAQHYLSYLPFSGPSHSVPGRNSVRARVRVQRAGASPRKTPWLSLAAASRACHTPPVVLRHRRLYRSSYALQDTKDIASPITK